MKRILIAFDGSESSYNAVEFIKNLIDNLKEKPETIELISVIQVIDLPEIPENQSLISYYKKYYKEKHEEIIKENPEFKSVILIGNVANEIINYSKEHKVDLIVVGKTGKSKLEQFLLGSVSKKIVDHAQTNVLIVN
jgi:nucleotide-binding universal stress UspA family protein